MNQFDIIGNEHRIPDAVIFINGLPVVVFEFKNALKQNTTIEDAYKDERKYICRYPQYFAARSLYQNILNHSKLNAGGDGKGGTYFGRRTEVLTKKKRFLQRSQ